MHYYSHNIGDYKRDTAHLSLLEHGIYRQMLDLYYLSEKPIPLETDWVIRRLAAETEVEQSAIRAVLKDFFKQTEEGYRHTRCDMEIREYQHKAETARTNGKRGGRPTKTDLVNSGMPEKSGSQANHKPLTINQEPKGKTPRKRSEPAPPISKPDDVEAQTWTDWLALRKAKKAPVTQTVLDGAVEEAAKAGFGLDAFLRIWCRRGSQGLEAEWLKSHELPQATGTSYSRHMDQRASELAPGVARKTSKPPITLEDNHVPVIASN